MEVVVQWVRTSWTKRSRGSEATAHRNATPVAFPLPAMPLPPGWSYRQDTLNVAYGLVSADLFLGTPAHHVDELASLF